MTTYVLDIDEIKTMNSDLVTDISSFRTTFARVQQKVSDRYGTSLPEGMRRLARDMFQAVTPDIPYMLECIVSGIIDSIGQEYERLVIRNPRGIYNLCAGLGRSGVDGKPWKLADITVEGDVGTFYGGMSAQRSFTHHIKGCAGRSFMDNAPAGKVILEGIADESAAQVNHGAYFLFKEYVGPRLAWAQRGGGVVTLKNLPFNAGLFMSQGTILTLGEIIEDQLGPDMQEGRIYTPRITQDTLGKGTTSLPVGPEDYPRIADALNPFVDELDVKIGGEEQKLTPQNFNGEHPMLMINGERYDFSSFHAILPQRIAIKKK